MTNSLPAVFSFTTEELTSFKFLFNWKPCLGIFFGPITSFQHSELLLSAALSFNAIFPFPFLLPGMFSLLYYWFVQLFTLICLMSVVLNRLPDDLYLVIQEWWSQIADPLQKHSGHHASPIMTNQPPNPIKHTQTNNNCSTLKKTKKISPGIPASRSLPKDNQHVSFTLEIGKNTRQLMRTATFEKFFPNILE